MRVTFQGLEFRTDADPSNPAARLVIGPGGWQGWDSLPTIRRENTPRSAGHGSHALPAYWGDRLVTVEGHAIADTPGDLAALGRKFNSVNLDYTRVEVFTDDHRVEWAFAGVQSATFIPNDDLGFATEAEFQMQLWMPDPWKYSDARRVELTAANPSQLVVNRGTANAWPVLRFEGPVTAPFGFTIAGRKVNVSKSLTAGQWIEVDTRTGAATTNSVEGGRLFSEVTGLMPFIPPGSRTFTWSLTGKCVVTWSDTYK